MGRGGKQTRGTVFCLGKGGGAAAGAGRDGHGAVKSRGCKSHGVMKVTGLKGHGVMKVTGYCFSLSLSLFTL